MARGRKPTTRVMKEIKGNPGKRKVNKAEPIPREPIGPNPPEYLEMSESQSEVWERVYDYTPVGMVTLADEGLLYTYCVSVDAMLRLGKKTQDVLHQSANGDLKVNPALGEIRRLSGTVKSLAAELGLSPVSRTRIAMPEKKNDDERAIALGITA